MATSVPNAQTKLSSNPLIPEQYLDVPSQRLYYLSLGLLCQVSIFTLNVFSCLHDLPSRPLKSLTSSYHLHQEMTTAWQHVGNGFSSTSLIALYYHNSGYQGWITASQISYYTYVFCGFWMVSCLGELASIFQLYLEAWGWYLVRSSLSFLSWTRTNSMEQASQVQLQVLNPLGFAILSVLEMSLNSNSRVSHLGRLGQSFNLHLTCLHESFARLVLFFSS